MDNVFEQCDHQRPYHGGLSPAILSFSSIISTVGCSSHLGSTSQRSAVRIPFVSHRIRPGNMDREQHCMRIRQIRLAMAWLPPHDSEEELAEESNTVGDRPNGTWIYYANSECIYPYGWN
ncbi:hypothetical protein BO85DRAFT_473264 [Aspergillus piperis CBS 112811]|uniref:Uncharacterized protein n=1 Tax=Aspergillus piperis CBS 112811 TaxID=1448313 RepID=A0A8G1QRR2_9EURO|nr:hypothetical protein BO85DRAFT_473264 [Aspergillus piperis CBS 112811]RAH51642.1 hypothetical protein BO85DRAFT_473264 [Aspergillus piperis CBS 112811]